MHTHTHTHTHRRVVYIPTGAVLFLLDDEAFVLRALDGLPDCPGHHVVRVEPVVLAAHRTVHCESTQFCCGELEEAGGRERERERERDKTVCCGRTGKGQVVQCGRTAVTFFFFKRPRLNRPKVTIDHALTSTSMST